MLYFASIVSRGMHRFCAGPRWTLLCAHETADPGVFDVELCRAGEGGTESTAFATLEVCNRARYVEPIDPQVRVLACDDDGARAWLRPASRR